MALKLHQEYKPPATPAVNKSEWTNTPFMNRLVVYYASKAGAFNHSTSEAHGMITDFVYNLLENGDEKFRVPRCNIKGFGGFFENPNNPKTKDCDFNIVLDIPESYVNFKHICNRENDAPNRATRQRYFKGGFTDFAKLDDNFVNLWRCLYAECGHSGSTIDCNMALDARIVHQQFHASVLKGIRNIFEIGEELSKPPYCFVTGPAITIALQETEFEKYNLDEHSTIDLALTIPLSRDWRNCCSLSSIHVDSPQLVPSGNFWRLSFSEAETDVIIKSSNEARIVYFATKAIRDKVVPELPTYPIKQAFLHQLPVIEEKLEEARGAEGEFWCLADCVITLCDHMTDEADNGALFNYHQRDDPVMEKSDASYIQHKRLKEYIINQNKRFLKFGRLMLLYEFLITIYSIYDICFELSSANWDARVYFSAIDISIASFNTILVIVFLIILIRGKNLFKTLYIYGVTGYLVLHGCTSLFASITITMIHLSDYENNMLYILSMFCQSTVVLHAVVNSLLFLCTSCRCKPTVKSNRNWYECVLTQQLWMRVCCPRNKEYMLHKQERRAEVTRLVV